MKLDRAIQSIGVFTVLATLCISVPSNATADSKRHIKAVVVRPSADDMNQLTALMTQLHSSAKLTNVSIAGNFALVAWHNGPVGGEFLASNSSGTWMLVAHDHGSFTPAELVAAAPGLDADTAQTLFDSAGSQPSINP